MRTRQRINEENFVIEYFDVVLFMKQKQRRKKRKQRDKSKETKESKKERQEEAKNRLRRNKGRHSKINKKCPFLGEKKQAFLLNAKKGKEKTKQN